LQILLHVVREEVTTTNEKFRAKLVESFGWGAPTAPGEAIRHAGPHLASPPGLVQRSCGSTVLHEEDVGVTFPMDKITQQTTCKLYIHHKFFDMKVVIGLAWPAGEGVMLHNRPLHEGYAKVTIDTLAKRKYKNVELDISADDSKFLGDNIGGFVAWRKRNIIFESESESSDHDPQESLEKDLPPPPCLPPRKEQTPPSPPTKKIEMVIENTEVIISEAILRTDRKARGTM